MTAATHSEFSIKSNFCLKDIPTSPGLCFDEEKVHNRDKAEDLLDARGFRALRRHCITHRHDSVVDITKWAQKYFQKPLSVNTIRRAICRCQLKLYHAKRKPYVNMVQKRRRVLWAKANLKWTVSKWKSVLWSDESKFDILVGNHGCRVLRAKEEGDLPACHQLSFQKKVCIPIPSEMLAFELNTDDTLEGPKS